MTKLACSAYEAFIFPRYYASSDMDATDLNLRFCVSQVLCVANGVHAPPAPAVSVTILPGTKPATSSPTTPAVLAAHPSPTPTHAPASGNTPAADDDDLPYCDEL